MEIENKRVHCAKCYEAILSLQDKLDITAKYVLRAKERGCVCVCFLPMLVHWFLIRHWKDHVPGGDFTVGLRACSVSRSRHRSTLMKTSSCLWRWPVASLQTDLSHTHTVTTQTHTRAHTPETHAQTTTQISEQENSRMHVHKSTHRFRPSQRVGISPSHPEMFCDCLSPPICVSLTPPGRHRETERGQKTEN